MAETTVNVVPTEAAVIPRHRAAYAQLIDEIRKVPDSELVLINVDIPTAVTAALGALPEIRALRPRIVAEMSQYDIERFDKVESYALAAWQANTEYAIASAPIESLDALSAEGAQLRRKLFADATAMAERGFIDGHKLKELDGPVGYQNLAVDLSKLAGLLRKSQLLLSGKTPVTLAELDRAEILADRISTAVGLREQGPAAIASTADIRKRAFSLFVSAYDHARRAVHYLRWKEDDADKIAPSLYSGRTTVKQKAETPANPTPPVAPATAVPASLVAKAPSVPVPAEPPIGHPNSNPFTTS
jgi:hypothetical protein